MRQNKNSRRNRNSYQAPSKNLKYMKTFESFGKDYDLLLEEEAWLKNALMAGLITFSSMFGMNQAQAKAETVEAKGNKVETVMVTDLNKETDLVTQEHQLDTTKTYVKTKSTSSKFTLDIDSRIAKKIIIQVGDVLEPGDKEHITTFSKIPKKKLSDTGIRFASGEEKLLLPLSQEIAMNINDDASAFQVTTLGLKTGEQSSDIEEITIIVNTNQDKYDEDGKLTVVATEFHVTIDGKEVSVPLKKGQKMELK